MSLCGLLLAQMPFLKQENLIGLSVLVGIITTGVVVLFERLSNAWLKFKRETNLANEVGNKAKLDECTETKEQQARALDSFREAVADFSTISELNKSALDGVREELASVRHERDDLRGKLTVNQALQTESLRVQTEHLRELQTKLGAQFEQVTAILAKMNEIPPVGVSTTTTVTKSTELTGEPAHVSG